MREVRKGVHYRSNTTEIHMNKIQAKGKRQKIR